jgi:ribosomal protein S12 methylthiotransferase accessory factor YcaO
VGMGTEEVPNAWNNTSFRFTFQLVEDVGPAPVTAGEAQPVAVTSVISAISVAAGPSEADKQLALRRAVLEAAESRSIPANPDSALYKYARQHNLGEPVSLEFTLDHAGVSYTAQVYTKGVVYAPTGQPDQVAHIETQA